MGIRRRLPLGRETTTSLTLAETRRWVLWGAIARIMSTGCCDNDSPLQGRPRELGAVRDASLALRKLVVAAGLTIAQRVPFHAAKASRRIVTCKPPITTRLVTNWALPNNGGVETLSRRSVRLPDQVPAEKLLPARPKPLNLRTALSRPARLSHHRGSSRMTARAVTPPSSGGLDPENKFRKSRQWVVRCRHCGYRVRWSRRRCRWCRRSRPSINIALGVAVVLSISVVVIIQWQ
jgi:hypothetical protein